MRSHPHTLTNILSHKYSIPKSRTGPAIYTPIKHLHLSLTVHPSPCVCLHPHPRTSPTFTSTLHAVKDNKPAQTETTITMRGTQNRIPQWALTLGYLYTCVHHLYLYALPVSLCINYTPVYIYIKPMTPCVCMRFRDLLNLHGELVRTSLQRGYCFFFFVLLLLAKFHMSM